MAKGPHKLTLSPSRDIPFDRLVLSQANVRRVKTGVSIPELAADIYRRTLLQSLNVRPLLGEDGSETGLFEVPAGGRRYRALEHLVKTKRMASTALIPCIVKPADSAVSAEEDSFAENIFRQSLHPLDQFRAMQTMVDKGDEVEAIAAHFMTTPAVVGALATLQARGETVGVDVVPLEPRLDDFNSDLCALGLDRLARSIRSQLLPVDASRFLID